MKIGNIELTDWIDRENFSNAKRYNIINKHISVSIYDHITLNNNYDYTYLFYALYSCEFLRIFNVYQLGLESIKPTTFNSINECKNHVDNILHLLIKYNDLKAFI